jgi:hypothetical protein
MYLFTIVMVLYNILYVSILYIFWIITQYFLENDIHPNNKKIIDRTHNFCIFRIFHKFLCEHKNVSNIIIIFTSLLIDINVIYFACDFMINNNTKPILLLIVGIILRQICQCINRLPSPKDVIWFDPGFPTLLMNYNVKDDFFFSGHTLVSLIFGIELLNSPILMVQYYAIFFMCVEIMFVLCSRVHYFMDIYGAISTYFMMCFFYNMYF